MVREEVSMFMFFFFSSRRRHTRFKCDWSSDVCSSDLMLNGDGYVAEATGDNIFIVERGSLLTPPTYVGILEGITRSAVIGLAQQLQIPFAERVFTLTTLYNCDECFLTGTGAEVIPVIRVDERVIGDGRPGPLTKSLIQAFHALVAAEGVEICRSEPAHAQPRFAR